MFHAPTTITLSGTTGSGKTTLLFNILQHKDQLFTTAAHKVLYCYGVWQSLFDIKEKELDIDFHEGVPTEETINNFADGKHNIIIVDDLMEQVVKNQQIQHLFTRGSHHRNLTVIYLNQNMFSQGKYARTMNLNTHYMILLKNPRDLSQIAILGRQIGLGKTLVEAYKDCIAQPYGYLVIDLSPHNEDCYQLKTNIFPGQDTIVYIPT